MENKVSVNVSVCMLLAWSLWAAGVGMFVLIALGVLPYHLGGVAFVLFMTGNVLFIKHQVGHLSERRQDAAFEMGRASVGGPKVRPIH